MGKFQETVNKREKEKKRLKQKEDKKQKAEERKANKTKGASLEDMMAYLDENGNLTDRPQDPRIKKVFKQEDIQIGVAPQSKEPDVAHTGVVNFFNRDKGFGFINDAQSAERLFFHINNVSGVINESDKVEFFVERSPRGLSAIQVKKLN